MKDLDALDIQILNDSFLLDEAQYEISFERINTPEKLLGWVHHLLGKNWVEKEKLQGFIEVVSEKLNVTIDYLS